jgi:hypothetical protein
LQWKVYGQGNGQVYERNNDKIGDLGNVSINVSYLRVDVFDVSIIDIDGF